MISGGWMVGMSWNQPILSHVAYSMWDGKPIQCMQFYIDFQIIIDYPVLGLTDIYISDHIRYLDHWIGPPTHPNPISCRFFAPWNGPSTSPSPGNSPHPALGRQCDPASKRPWTMEASGEPSARTPLEYKYTHTHIYIWYIYIWYIYNYIYLYT